MRELGQLDQRAVAPAETARARAPQIYQRYAATLYAQALLILGEQDPAEQVACDVMVDESIRNEVPGEDTDGVSRRLAVSVLRRCRQLAVGPRQPSPGRQPTPGRHQLPGRHQSPGVQGLPDAQDGRVPSPRLRPPGQHSQADALSLLRHPEREALSLVLFGRLGYRQVARELAISPQEAAALLRAALISLKS